MEVRDGGKNRAQRSYASELLDLAVATGRRISAICALTYADLRLTRTDTAPHGAIRWPASTDKSGGKLPSRSTRSVEARPIVSLRSGQPSGTHRSSPHWQPEPTDNPPPL